MEFSVGVGKSDFAEIRSKKNYYVDKTELIYELVGKPENNVTLFTRPRRFGKTLTMSCYGVAFYRKRAMVRLAGNLPEGLLYGGLPR